MFRHRKQHISKTYKTMKETITIRIASERLHELYDALESEARPFEMVVGNHARGLKRVAVSTDCAEYFTDLLLRYGTKA